MATLDPRHRRWYIHVFCNVVGPLSLYDEQSHWPLEFYDLELVMSDYNKDVPCLPLHNRIINGWSLQLCIKS